jgi:uncharacterized protein
MLKVDLGQLQGGTRFRIDARVPASDPLWAGAGPDLADGLHVHVEAQNVSGAVVVRGRIGGTIDLPCRRCLAPVRATFDEPVTLLFRSGAEGERADLEDVYPIPERASAIDLGPAIREHTLLAVPEFALCRDDCAGLCPRCGTDLNLGSCHCTTEEIDVRWAELRRLRPEQ